MGTKNSHIIDCTLRIDDEVEWRCSGIYGRAEKGNNVRTWDLTTYLGQENSMPWLLGGDFNKVLFADEKNGGMGLSLIHI